jgi:hypothetical protein
LAVTIEFYRTRAKECEAAAEASGLDNVKDRYLRSAKAWAEMADKMDRTEAMREQQAREKAHAVG